MVRSPAPHRVPSNPARSDPKVESGVRLSPPNGGPKKERKENPPQDKGHHPDLLGILVYLYTVESKIE